MDTKNFTSAIAQIAEEKGISLERVLESIEMAIAAAYKKDYGKKGQIIKAKLDQKSGGLRFWQIKLVVDESMIYSEEELEKLKDNKIEAGPAFDESSAGKEGKVRFNPERHIMLDEAKKIEPKIKIGESLEIALTPQKDYGRIAAQTAKQVILQKIREAERESVLTEYKSKEGEIVSGIVQRIEGRNIFFDIGKALGILVPEEQIPGEFYRPGQRLKVYILKVEDASKGPLIFLSRVYPKLISKLFELEVPEVASDQVQIKSIAREAGFRTKIAVASSEESLDPIGSMVGQRGTRVMAVINELGGEKIDIIAYSDDPEKYIANALSPAKVVSVKVLPRNKALVSVPDDQLSLAIGKDGQNVRLAAKLTGWKIDVQGAGSKDGAETAEPAEAEDGADKGDVVQKEEKKEIEKQEVEKQSKTKNKKAKSTTKKPKTT